MATVLLSYCNQSVLRSTVKFLSFTVTYFGVTFSHLSVVIVTISVSLLYTYLCRVGCIKVKNELFVLPQASKRRPRLDLWHEISFLFHLFFSQWQCFSITFSGFLVTGSIKEFRNELHVLPLRKGLSFP